MMSLQNVRTNTSDKTKIPLCLNTSNTGLGNRLANAFEPFSWSCSAFVQIHPVTTSIGSSHHELLLNSSTHQDYPNSGTLNKIELDDCRLIVSPGVLITFVVEREGDDYLFYNEKFGIYGIGKSRDKAFREFEIAFVEYYEDIVNTPDSKLPRSSLDMKRLLQAFATLKYNV